MLDLGPAVVNTSTWLTVRTTWLSCEQPLGWVVCSVENTVRPLITLSLIN